jgi:hypothetical protein
MREETLGKTVMWAAIGCFLAFFIVPLAIFYFGCTIWDQCL